MNPPARGEVEELRRQRDRYLDAQQQDRKKLTEAEERLKEQQEPSQTSKADKRPSSTHRESEYCQTGVASKIFEAEISNKNEQRNYFKKRMFGIVREDYAHLTLSPDL